MTPEDFLTPEQEKSIVQAIKKAEKNTSGEVCVHLEKNEKTPDKNRALEVFHKLGIQNTAQRNGVLFYVDVDNKIFSIIGDEGIHKVVPENFWDSIKDKVIYKFKNQKYAEGLIDGINEIGIKLKKYFPYKPNDKNELPDEISKNY